LLVGPEDHPRLRLSVPEGRLVIDDEPLDVGALWVRHDVFAALADPRAAGRSAGARLV
jgi:hypothetical protein